MDKITVFLIVGRLASNLQYSKILPFVYSKKINCIFVFSQFKGPCIKKVEYITLPKFLIKIQPKMLNVFSRRFYEPIQILYYFLKYKPDVISGFYTLPKGVNSFLVSKLTGRKCIVAVLGGRHEIEKKYMRFPRLWERLNLFMLKRCNFVFTKGKRDNEFLVSKGINPKKIRIFNGCIDIYRYSYNNEIRKIDILFVGTLYELKGPDRVLLIMKKLKEHFPGIQSVFLGDGKMKNDLISFIMKNDLKKNVKFVGYVSNPEDYYKKSKLYILPSRTEGLSTAMLESMACGCIPIVSDVGNLTEAAWHNINAMVVKDYQDIETFTNYTKELLLNDRKRNEMSKNAQNLIIRKYSPKAQSEILEEVFERMEKK